MTTKNSIIKKLVVAYFFLSFSACDSNNSNDNNKPNPQNQNIARIVVSKDGVGPINAQTPFNMHQMTVAFQDFSVTEFTQSKQGVGSPVIRVSEEGKPLLIINPDSQQQNIFSVFILSPRIGNALNHPIGTQYNKIYPHDQLEPCAAGSDDFIGKVLCAAPSTPNILYAFTGEHDTTKLTTPPLETLANWHLDTIIWKAP